MRLVEIFMGPIAVTCAGGPTPAKQERISKAFALRHELEKNGVPEVELVAHDLGDEAGYESGLKAFAACLREAGEVELAERAAYSVSDATPAVAVDGRMVWLRDCPTIDELSGYLFP